MTSTSTTVTAAALAATFGLAVVCWVIAIPRMSEMDMGVATPAGSLASFMSMWMLMMAAMMLPGLASAVLRHVREDQQVSKVLAFVGSYLLVWAFIGIPFYALYRPHRTFVAGAITIAAGVYELTPLKQAFRRRCCNKMRSGFECGLSGVGSCIGLMLMQVALGLMSVTWMLVVAVLVFGQKLLHARAGIDILLALMIIGLGILIVVVPGLIIPL